MRVWRKVSCKVACIVFFFCSFSLVPADGVKGKTWGPSTLHQRERGAIICQPPNPTSPGGKRWSRSAPDLEKTPLRTALLANAHRSPLLQEIGNPNSRKLYFSANNLIDNQPIKAASDIPQYVDYVMLNVDDIEKELETVGDSKESDHAKEINYSRLSFRKKGSSENSINFIQSVASTLVVGTAKRVKKRDRSKSKESIRRNSSESRLNSLADFFRSPSGSRKSSLNYSHSTDRKSSITVRANDVDGIESSPESSVGKKCFHKSRGSKSPLRMFSKIKAWGSRDALDDRVSGNFEYSALKNSVILQKLENSESDLGTFTPTFLIANSREGVDFESLEAALCSLDAEHSNDGSKLKNSLNLDQRFKPGSSHQVSLHHSSTWSNYEELQFSHCSDDKPLLNQKFKSSDNLRNCEKVTYPPSRRTDVVYGFDQQSTRPANSNNEKLDESLKSPNLSRRSSEGSNLTSPNFHNTQRFFRKNNN